MNTTADADTPIRDIVLVGGGLAAAKAAESVREAGYDGRLTLVTDEPERPYERPPLSKGFLVADTPAEDVHVHPAGFYADHDVELVVGDAVARVDRDAGEVVTASGRVLAFDRLLLATGAEPRQLPHVGERASVRTLRTLADSRRLGEELRRVDHVTIVGAGWIGCEVAAAARTLDTDVTLVDPLELPLARVLGPTVGAVYRDLHAEHGVDLRLGVGVTGIVGGGSDAGAVVQLGDGQRVETELVVVGIGVVPRVALAQDAGLDVDDGIVVDDTLATSDPRILAAGDAARAWHPALGRHLRVEHWANALNQGLTAGRNLLGAGEVYDRVPYFFSDQYDLGMEYSGFGGPDDEVVVRGDLGSRGFIAFWRRDGRVVAAMNANVWDVVGDLQSLIRSGAAVDPAKLRDPDVALADLS